MLTLSGSIPGLLRRGSPVGWRDEETPYVVTFALADTVLAAPGSSPCLGLEDDPSNFTLDLDDPTGRYHAILWLRERGHDLRWAENESQVLAWSVLSVHRGGRPIRDVLKPWTHTPGDPLWPWARRPEHPTSAGPFIWVDGYGWRGLGFKCGHEIGQAGRDAADRFALTVPYALRNEDRSLILPELPSLAEAA